VVLVPWALMLIVRPLLWQRICLERFLSMILRHSVLALSTSQTIVLTLKTLTRLHRLSSLLTSKDWDYQLSCTQFTNNCSTLQALIIMYQSLAITRQMELAHSPAPALLPPPCWTISPSLWPSTRLLRQALETTWISHSRPSLTRAETIVSLMLLIFQVLNHRM